MGKFVKLATTGEIANQPARCIEVEGQKIALFKSEDAFCAMPGCQASSSCSDSMMPRGEAGVPGATRVHPELGAGHVEHRYAEGEDP